jgi:hypothetical protein
VESIDSISGPEGSKHRTEITNRATKKGEAYKKAVARIGVADYL